MLSVLPVLRGHKSVLVGIIVLLSAVVMSFAALGTGQAVADTAPRVSVSSATVRATPDGEILEGLMSQDSRSDLPDDVRVWFNSKAVTLGQSLRGYLPDSAKVSPDAQIEVGIPTQVATWSARLLRGTYNSESAVTPIDMWVAPVSIENRELGVVVYTEEEKDLYPLRLPSRADALAPKTTAGVPEPTLSSRENSPQVMNGFVLEPKNSHLPVRLDEPGASYALPELAHELVTTAPDAAHHNRPVYDPIIHGWFMLDEERLLPVSNAARARVVGAVTLAQVQEAVQSWWGTVNPTPTPTTEALPTSSNTLVWVVVLAVAIVGIALLVVWLTFRWQSRTEESAEVLSLPDPELILVPMSPPTSAVPTLAVNGSTGEAH
ncbi:hypothetical protein [Mobiluncus curtisii]|uniref:hypothetical protein n=1 Tax=Mobiluncus curtisii TaxID=2051 RepID=UPI00242BDF15|nr:hypothetical protein [Mobiluncus curtisii]